MLIYINLDILLKTCYNISQSDLRIDTNRLEPLYILL